MCQVFIAKYWGQLNLLNFERNRRTVISTSRYRQSENWQRYPATKRTAELAASTSCAPVVGQRITPCQACCINRLNSEWYLGESGIVADLSSTSTIQSAHFHLIMPLIYGIFPYGFEHSGWIPENNLIQRIGYRNFSIAQIRGTGTLLR